jgi:tetratricopeptide (TPR) repeat protein
MVLAAGFMAVSCSSLGIQPFEEKTAEEPQARIAPKVERPEREASPKGVRQAMRLVEQGEYERALSIIREGVAAGESEADYAHAYVQAIQSLQSRGLSYFLTSQYDRAGLTFRAVLESFPTSESLRARIRYSREEVTSYVSSCADRLMENGLLHYRNGNLGQAIQTWEKVLRFDPFHPEARKALETARVQLRHLKTIE